MKYGKERTSLVNHCNIEVQMLRNIETMKGVGHAGIRKLRRSSLNQQPFSSFLLSKCTLSSTNTPFTSQAQLRAGIEHQKIKDLSDIDIAHQLATIFSTKHFRQLIRRYDVERAIWSKHLCRGGSNSMRCSPSHQPSSSSSFKLIPLTLSARDDQQKPRSP